MSKTALGGNRNGTPQSPGRNTRAQYEKQQKLRAIYADSSNPSSNDSSNPASPSGSEDSLEHPTVDARSSRGRGLRDKNAMSPVPDDGAGRAATDAPKKSAVTPSPNRDDGDDDDDVASPAPPPPPDETPAARLARRRAHPLKDIMEPGPHDCLFGRGGGTNHHPGNKTYRKMVEDKKGKYLRSKRLDKPLVAMEIIKEWRELDPPGRFLKQDDKTKLWSDVGDKKAREKTSQALREKTPVKQREGGGGGAGGGVGGPTQFAPGTRYGRHGRPGHVARDHSLGETQAGTDMTLEGFSWDDSERPVVRNADADVEGRGGGGARQRQFRGHYRHRSGELRRDHTLGTTVTARPPATAPEGYGEAQGPPPSPYYDRQRYPRYGPPPSHPPQGHPHPPPQYGSYPPHGYASPEHRGYASPPQGDYPPPEAPPGGYDYQQNPPQQRGREHSLILNPLKGANTSQPSRGASIFAGEERPPPPTSPYASAPPPPPPPPLPSPRYDEGPPPLPPPAYGGGGYGSPRTNGWPTPPPPTPQFTYPGSNGSSGGGGGGAFGRYDSSTSGRSGSIQSENQSMKSLGSSVDAFYDRRDSGRSAAGSRASGTSAVDPAAAGTSQDYSKIAELIREASDKSATTAERRNSWDHGERGVNEYEDTIPRSNTMPYEESGVPVKGSPRRLNSRQMSEDSRGPPPSPVVHKPSLIRKLSGGGLARKSIPTEDAGGEGEVVVYRPEPVKRDTSNQPEAPETKRSVKRVGLSRDRSAVARKLKEEQFGQTRQKSVGFVAGFAAAPPKLGGRALSKAEMLDRKLSVEINRLGLEDINENNRHPDAAQRMTTDAFLLTLIDGEAEGEALGTPSPTVGSPAPPAMPSILAEGGRLTTIDAIAIDIANGGGGDSAEWDDALNLIEEPGGPPPDATDPESAGVNDAIAEKWLKGET